MTTTLEIIANLIGQGTEHQQELFQASSDRITEVYRDKHPDDSDEDLMAMTVDHLIGAALYSLGNKTLEGLATSSFEATLRAEMAEGQLIGAMIAAREDQMDIAQIARRTGGVWQTVYKHLGL